MEKFFGEKKEKNIYLDNGASTLALLEVKNTTDEFLMNYGSVHRGSGYNSETSTMLYEQARDNILECIEGTKQDHAVIFTANTTDGINKFALMSNFRKILVSDIEHSSNRLPWEKNFQVVELKTVDFKIDIEELESTLSKERDIELVALTGASNITGYVTDIQKVYEICKKYNVIFFLDASQYAPHFKPSLNDCDVMVYCGHKMYAPFGAGVLAGKKSLFRNDRNAVTGGGNVVYARNDFTIYKDVPYMHESGTPNGIGCVAISKAHDILYKKIGEKNLLKHANDLCDEIDKICDRLEGAGYKIYFGRKVKGVQRTPVLVLSNTKKSNKETVDLLNKSIGKYKKNIFCREGAFCAYRLIEKIKEIDGPIIQDEKGQVFLNNMVKVSKGRYIADDACRLDDRYSLIRFSAGLINEVEDIQYLAGKLIQINS